MLLSRTGASSWKGPQPLASRFEWAAAVARVPELRQAGSSEAGRVPFGSNQVRGAHDYVAPACRGGGREGGTGQAKPATSSSLQNALVSIC